ncbi:MAG TPA: dynamin family protein [Streptosporangiaceae bacterium]|nr:dynamin family protein [Streptosporangiaceae bacterium]
MTRLAAGDGIDGLAAYRDRRLELGDMIRAALHLARSRADAAAEERSRELLARLAADRFQLAVMGQFSRGKSTLMNALLGGAYLPMGALPMTSVITTVRYGSRPKAMVRRHQSAFPVEVPLGSVTEFVAQASVRRSEMRVTSVDVEVPAEILRLGFEFADTPGVGSAAASTATTRQFLTQADAVVFVSGFDSPLSEAEAGFLAEASLHSGQLFLVLNKRDLVGDRDAAEVENFVRDRLRDDLGLGEPRIFAVSALEALEAVLHGDQARLSASGLPQLRGALEQFLIRDKTRLFLRNVADRTAGLVAGQRQDLRLGRVALDGGPAIPDVLSAFDARIAELADLQRAAAARIASTIDTSLPSLLAARSGAWQAGLSELLAPAIEGSADADDDDAAAADGGGGESVRVVLDRRRAALERAAQDAAGPWLRRRAGEVRELLIGMTASEIGALLEAARSPGAIGARLAGLPTAAQDGREPAGWSARDIPDVTVRVPPWTISAAAPRRRHRRPGPGDPSVRHLLAAAVTAAVTAFDEQVRAQFQAAARDWAARIEDQAGRQLGEAAEHFRRCLRTPPREEDETALDDLATRLDGLCAALDAGDSLADSKSAGQIRGRDGAPDAARGGDCVVCAQLARALGEHLRRSQFLLATREGDQARHALAGGYCPLHTWEYAAIASPLGISAGYAKVAADIADALESASRGPDLAHSVAALIPRPGGCAVCRTLAACERGAINEIVSGAPDKALCLRHLALALSAGPSPEAARAMLGALAAALRRDSEDMRDYALKREGLHSGLITAEESRAHLDALRHLAGLPELARPWADEDA